MNKFIFIFLLILVTPLTAYAAANQIEKNQICYGKQILGKIEKVVLMDQPITLEAKLDTGAESSSLSARHISTFERNHQTWVRFTIQTNHPSDNLTLAKPLIKNVRILKRKDERFKNNEKYNLRPAIILPICIGNQIQPVLINLVDRSSFQYPMLIGSEALKKFNVMVDVSQSHVSDISSCPSPNGSPKIK